MDKGAKQLGRRMLAIYNAVEEKTAQSATAAGATCSKGCAACCNNQIIVSLPEAVAMVEPFLRQPNLLTQVIQRCYEQLPHQKLDRTQHYAQSIPCVFLTADKACGIYDRRPIPCRNYYVVSPPEDCAWKGESKEVVKLDLSRLDTYMVQESMRVSKQRQVPILLAPIPVAVLWAIRLLSEGEVAFNNALENEKDLGILDIRGWTQHVLRQLDAAATKSSAAEEAKE